MVKVFVVTWTTPSHTQRGAGAVHSTLNVSGVLPLKASRKQMRLAARISRDPRYTGVKLMEAQGHNGNRDADPFPATRGCTELPHFGLREKDGPCPPFIFARHTGSGNGPREFDLVLFQVTLPDPLMAGGCSAVSWRARSISFLRLM